MKMDTVDAQICPPRTEVWEAAPAADDAGVLCAQFVLPPRHRQAGGPSGLRVQDIMSLNVVAVLAESNLRLAVEIMGRYSFAGLPVIDEGNRPLGVLSERDILRFLRRGGEHWHPSSLWDLVLLIDRSSRALPHSSVSERLELTTVREIMTAPAVTIGPDAPIRAALELMLTRGIHRLIVVREGRIVGILTRRDLLPSLRSAEP